MRIYWFFFFLCLGMTGLQGQTVQSYRQTGKGVICITRDGELQILPLGDNAVRVRFHREQVHHFPEWVYVDSGVPAFAVDDGKECLTVCLKGMKVVINKGSGQIAYVSPDGKPVLREDSRRLADSSVQGEKTFCAEQSFFSPTNECLYGLGQFQDGYLNVRGLTRRLTQVNTQIAIPFVLSSEGYGLLWNNYGLTEFNPADSRIELLRGRSEGTKEVVDVTSAEGGTQEVREGNVFSAELDIPVAGKYALLLDVGQKMARRHHLSVDGKTVVELNNLWLPPTASVLVDLEAGRHSLQAELTKEDKPVVYYRRVDDRTVFRSPVSDGIDYTVFVGNADEVIASYRRETGEVPMLPQWAMGYIHCRERFHSQQEILETALSFRRNSLPADMMVQDWQYWGRHGWNAMRFDEEHYPDPKKLVEDLHAMDMRLMISVWSKVDLQSEVGKMMNERGYFIPNTTWVDFFNPEAAAFYWENFSSRLLKPYGIDAWWQDATEPENDDLEGRRIWNGTLPGELYRNVYPLLVNKTVYEGSRKDMPDKRTMILTRSGFPGMQRYASATWSGDVGNDWETFRRQIVGGLGMSVSGLPWWTYDAGGFFRPRGQYTDVRYHERFLRWLQTSVFLPLMRVHGYMTNTEFWNYGDTVTTLARQALNTRYRLFPYIYSEAAAISMKGSTMMRPLVMDFADDRTALEQKYEYMFGPSLLVAPVVEESPEVWNVYLPETEGGWYDFWTGRSVGKGWSSQSVVPEHIPVFVKAGTILPLADVCQSTVKAAESDWEIRVFVGADGEFSVYEDEGVNYNYEHKAYAVTRFTWDDSRGELTVHARKGEFPGMKPERTLRIVKVDGLRSFDEGQSTVKEVVYKGGKLVVRL